MIKTYFKIAFRNIMRYTVFSFINVIGLTIGLSASFIIGLMVFSLNAQAEKAFEIFESQVHPVLKNKCSSCHGFLQAPYHSTNDAEESYEEARPLINLNFPSRSKLWVRSYNGHCDDSSLCETQNDDFKKAIFSWIAQEKAEQVEKENKVFSKETKSKGN